MTLKISLVFNNTNWQSIAEKVDAIRSFFKPDFDLDISVFHTQFTDMPFVSVGTINGVENTPGTTTTVDTTWYSKNISSLSPDADVVVLYLNQHDDDYPRTSVGIMQGRFDDTVQCCIFGITETDHAYIYNQATGQEMDQGNSFVLFTCHEISHALYLIQDIPDNTHPYFYSGQSTKVLDDLKDGRLTKMAKLLAYIKQLILLMTITQSKTTTYQSSIATAADIPSEEFPVNILTWAEAIKREEGWCLPGETLNGDRYPDGSLSYQHNNPGNMKYSSLMASWGAIKGSSGSDGGSFARFPTYQQGHDALCKFLILGCKDQLLAFHESRTIKLFTQKYANPPAGSHYADNVAHALGVSVETNINTLI